MKTSSGWCKIFPSLLPPRSSCHPDIHGWHVNRPKGYWLVCPSWLTPRRAVTSYCIVCKDRWLSLVTSHLSPCSPVHSHLYSHFPVLSCGIALNPAFMLIHPDAFILRRLSDGSVVKNPPPRCIHFKEVIRCSVVKNPPPSAGDTRDSGSQVRFLGGKDPLEEEIAIHSSILAWKTSWTEEPVQATVHGITKSHTRLNTYTAPDNCILLPLLSSWSVYILKCISSVSSLSRVWFFVTPWTVAPQASLPITNSQGLLKLMSIELVMPSNRLILCRPLLLLPSIFSSIRVFSNESVLHIRWSKYWSFSFSTSPSNEYSALISFRMDWLHLLAVQGTLKSLLQHHSSKALILWCSWNAWSWNA